MWKKKDFAALALAAVGTFSLTLGIFLPRVVNATNGDEPAKVLSPVLHINGCDIQAQAEGTPVEQPNSSNAKQAQAMPGQLRVSAGPAPHITFVVKNTTDADASVNFAASMDYSQAGGRVMTMPQVKWSDAYDLVLKPGETKQIEVDTKVTLTPGLNRLMLRDASDTKTTVAALYFSALDPVAGQSASARSVPVKNNTIDSSKSVKFVTQSPAKSANASAGKSPVQQAVAAALIAANQPTPPAVLAPQALAKNDSPLP